MTAPSDLSVVLELALLTTDRTAAEDAALARVAAVAGLGDLIGGTQAPGGDSSLTETEEISVHIVDTRPHRCILSVQPEGR